MSRRCYRLGSLFFGFQLFVSLLPADDVPVSWINPNGGNWSIASNWSTGVVPNNGGGNTYDVTLGPVASRYNVLVDTSPTINSLSIQTEQFITQVEVAGTLTTGTLSTATSRVTGLTVDPGATLNASSLNFFSEGSLAINGTANVGTLGLTGCGGCPSVSVGSGGLLNVGSFGATGLGIGVAGTMNVANSNLTILGDGVGIGGSLTVGTGNLLPVNSPNTLINAGAINASFSGITVGNGSGCVFPHFPPCWGLAVGPDGTYDEVIGGPSSFGTLTGGGSLPISLAGTLAITLANSYIPPVGQTFTILNSGPPQTGQSITGTFSSIEGQTFNNGTEMWDVKYVSQPFEPVSEVELVAVATPEPSFLVLAGLGLLGIIWACRGGKPALRT
ncbi:MAG: PEP-CTERM sorting domain-containing protein [Acidobacteriia bacterium]|nr:PEP-CTERM sorting domain-containing protein [Terriglobia bacterium]